MSWYAIRTMPGSQQPQREYAVDKTRSKKGYRIVPSLNPRLSAIERSLSDAGITYYMPAEKRLVRDRLRTDLWKVRRFALVVGYIFVHEPQNWMALMDTPGVGGVVSNNGKPAPLTLQDVLMLRSREAEAEVEFDRQAREAHKSLRRKAKTHPELRRFLDKLDVAETMDIGAFAMPLKAKAA